MPGGGASGQGSTPRSAPQEVNDALKSMAQATEGQNRLMTELLRHFERVQRSVTDINKDLAYGHSEMRTLLKDTANLEFSMKRIQQLKNSRVASGSSKSGTIEYVRSLQQEYRILLQALNSAKGQDKFTRDIKRALEDYNKILQRVDKQSDATWDSHRIKEVNDELEAARKNVTDLQKRMERLKVTKVTEGFRQLGRAIDDAFDNRLLSAMSRTPGLGGFMKVMGARSRINDARADIGVQMSNRTQARRDALRENAREVHARFGSQGTKVLRQMGYTERLPGDPRHGIRKSHVLQRAAASAGAQAAGALEQMTVKTLTVQNMTGPGLGGVGRQRRSRGGRRNPGPPLGSPTDAAGDLLAQAESPLRALPGRGRRYQGNVTLRNRGAGPAPSAEEVASIMHGPQGVLGRVTNNLVGRLAKGNGSIAKWAQGRIAAGAGSATAGIAEGSLGMGGGLARGALGLASKVAVPAAIATALIQLRDKVATDNKEVHDALAGGGLYAGGQSVNRSYQNARNALMSTGFTNSALLGVTKQTNTALMANLQDQGWGVGATMSKAPGARGSVDLGQALEDHAGLAGGGFYGAMMQNTVYSGKNMGMSQDTSARLTLKLIEKFGQTTQATKEFFLGLDDMMQTSGISASKYVEAIDAITDNFDTMNKALTGTVSILTTLGKTGRMTGDQLKDVMSSVTKPNQMSTAQRAFNIQSMSQEDLATAAKGERASIQSDLEALNKQLAQKGIGPKLTEGFREQGDVEAAIQGSGMDAETQKALIKAIGDAKDRITAASAREGALLSGDPIRAASAIGNAGDSSATAWTVRRAKLRNIARQVPGSDFNKLLGGDKEEVSRFIQSPIVDQLQANGVIGPDGAQGEISAFSRLARTGAAAAINNARENVDWNHPEVTAAPGASEAEKQRAKNETDRHSAMWNTMVALQRARNPQASGRMSESQLVAQFRKDAKDSPGKLADELTNLSATLDQVMTPGSPLNVANASMKDLAAELAAQDKAKDIADKTRTTADVFASAFEYLFDRLVNLLTPIMNIMKFKWGGDVKTQTDAAEKDRQARLDRKGTLTDSLNDLNGGTNLQGDAREKWKKDKASLVKDLKELNTSDPDYWTKQQDIQKRIRDLAARSGEGLPGMDIEHERLAKEAVAENAGNAWSKEHSGTKVAADVRRKADIKWARDAEQWRGDGGQSGWADDPATYGGYLADAVGKGSLMERRKAFTDTFGTKQFNGINAVWGNDGLVAGAQAVEGSAGASVLEQMAKQSAPGSYYTKKNTDGGKTYITYYMTTTTPTVSADDAAAGRTPTAVGARR